MLTHFVAFFYSSYRPSFCYFLVNTATTSADNVPYPVFVFLAKESDMHTLSELCTAYRAEMAGIHAPSTAYAHAKFGGKLVRELGDVSLADVTPEVVRQWKVLLLQRYQPSTVHKYLSRFQAMLRFAVQCGWLVTDPVAQVRKPPPRRDHVRFLSPDELGRLFAACQASNNPLLYPIVRLALSTGGRKDELRCLRWEAVDLDRGRLHFVRTKTGRARSVVLAGEAWAILRYLAERRAPDCPWVFPRWHGRAPMALDSAWQTARRKAGLVDFRFHDLRHTFASYLAQDGSSLLDIAEALGHKSTRLVQLYAHLTEGHTRKVVERMLRRHLPGEAHPA
jgi:integrase